MEHDSSSEAIGGNEKRGPGRGGREIGGVGMNK